MKLQVSCDIITYGDKMRELSSLNIEKIYSVALINPKENENRIIHYGNIMPRYELIYKLSGEVITHFCGNTFKIKPGTVYILPKCNNADYYIERTVPGDCIDIFFDTASHLPPALFSFDFNENRKIYDLFQSIYRLWLAKPTGYYSKCMSEVYEILYEIQLKCEQYSPASKYNKIRPGIEYINKNLYNAVNYYTPADICGISYTYFKKLFIERFGVSPIKYVNNMRLERSKELISINKYSVAEIAKICGFESSYYFSKKFKEKYKLSPTEYKKLCIPTAPNNCS